MNDQSDPENLDSTEFQAWMNEFQHWQEALAEYTPAALLDQMMKDEHFLAFQRDFEAFQAEFKQFQQELEREVSKRAEQKAGDNKEPTRKSTDDAGAFEPRDWWSPLSEEAPPANNEDTKSDDSPLLHPPDGGGSDTKAA